MNKPLYLALVDMEREGVYFLRSFSTSGVLPLLLLTASKCGTDLRTWSVRIRVSNKVQFPTLTNSTTSLTENHKTITCRQGVTNLAEAVIDVLHSTGCRNACVKRIVDLPNEVG
uniref:Uncharacterized protein n=1 Tax=Ascaris lumbricoides TaxID=6252 RepID=A0A0M3IEP1_ASCLU